MISSPQLSAKSLEAPRRGASLTKCSRNPTLITREGQITSSRTVAC